MSHFIFQVFFNDMVHNILRYYGNNSLHKHLTYAKKNYLQLSQILQDFTNGEKIQYEGNLSVSQTKTIFAINQVLTEFALSNILLERLFFNINTLSSPSRILKTHLKWAHL